MIISSSIDLKKYLNNQKTAVALGSFDALHKGHIHIIKTMVKYANANKLVPVVQLVEFSGDEKVNTLEKRLDILRKLGVELVIAEQFTEDFKKVDYKTFVSEFLSERYNAKAVFAGDNYRFGYMAEGNTEKLCEECNKYDICAFVIPCVQIDDVVSSTKIREFIKLGDMQKTTEYMTRPYSVSGKVIHGQALGRTLDFPTANIELPAEQVVPKDGVYLTHIITNDGEFYGITNVGAKPTVDIKKRNIETYISGYEGDLYGKIIEVEFLKYLRDIKKFEDLEALKEQLKKDKKQIRGYGKM